MVIAVAIGLTFAAWAIWAGPGDVPTGNLQTNDLGYSVVSDQLTTVTSQVQVNPGTTVRCAIEVENKSFAIVGWKIVTVPPTSASQTNFRTDVRTSERGVTGLINNCWVP